ncbi:C17orf62 isoform 17 [Pan troglodytes]|uniref:Chromosome 17 open reading frame 62, isoform CRA_e n=3 Tax=Hominidae TaxID=9604 RepID=J3KTI1_HUMAN|nr:chromosome 17 open reading frame 62, isoform CRA_e [Homo sapiens]KAI2585886.1 cytochrome b-245 chaperone 1 [Homo sapiens]KAI4052401.1 cytochrome b-245 chaperone 1 [Homo sapiens]PNI21470.1 C17orf62 isoform 17 [Pan troglodytes]PNJ87473.1 C17orf62 isoform 26 [Pongo abelii]
MYLQVETRTSSRLHLKRAPGIRSWSLLESCRLAWLLPTTAEIAWAGSSSTSQAACLWLCRTWRTGRKPSSTRAQGRLF